jgi:cytochrome c oxidase assembly protein subunit 15
LRAGLKARPYNEGSLSHPSCLKMLHRFATFLAGCTVLLVLAGSLVTSTGSGLSVPDWPTSYGWNMFTFPPSKWVGGIFYEHGHRLIASGVGFLTIVLTAWLWLSESRRWVRWLGVVALATVIAQGILGGLTVLFFLPAAISTAHAALAEVFFCLVVSIALFTAPSWRAVAAGPSLDRSARTGDASVRTIATATTALIYAQILVGAAMRHTEAGLAIPDFPLMFGRLLPTHWDPKIAVHFAHRVGALVVIISVLTTWVRVQRHRRQYRDLTRPATLLVFLVAVQFSLGAATVLSARNVWINSLHVVCGALVLATSLTVTLKSWRALFPDQGPMNVDSAEDFGMSSHGFAPNHGVQS